MNRAERHGWAPGCWAHGPLAPWTRQRRRTCAATSPKCAAYRDEATQLRDAVEGLLDAGELASPSVSEAVLSTIHSRVGPEAEQWLAEGAPATPPRIRVALVDDEADIRSLWRIWLVAAGGFEVVGEAGDGDARRWHWRSASDPTCSTSPCRADRGSMRSAGRRRVRP